MNSTENYTVSFFRNQCDYTKVFGKRAVCACTLCVCAGLLMNCQSLREILLSSVIVSLALPDNLKLTHTQMGPITLQNTTKLSNTVTCTPSLFPSCYPISFWSFCRFLQHSNPFLFLSISVCLFLTFPHSAAVGYISPFLGRFFSSCLT